MGTDEISNFMWIHWDLAKGNGGFLTSNMGVQHGLTSPDGTARRWLVVNPCEASDSRTGWFLQRVGGASGLQWFRFPRALAIDPAEVLTRPKKLEDSFCRSYRDYLWGFYGDSDNIPIKSL